MTRNPQILTVFASEYSPLGTYKQLLAPPEQKKSAVTFQVIADF